MSGVISNTFDNVKLTKVIRAIVPTPGLQSLAAVLPDNNVQARSFKIEYYEKSQQVAQYRAYDTASPVAERRSFTTKTGSLPPISLSSIVSEDEELSIYERTLAGDWDPDIEGAIYDDAAILTDAIHNRIEIARGQVLETGTFDIAENGVIQTADFGRPAGNATSVATAWSSTGSATPLTDIRAVVEQSRDERDEEVAAVILSSAQISNLLLNAQIRSMLASAGVSPALATRDGLNSLLSAHGLPTIIEYDRKINGTRVMSVDKAIFIPRPSPRMGETKWGVTAEALKLKLDIQERPGIVGTVMTSDNPVQTVTNVAAISMPVLNDPNLIYTLDTEV